MSDVFARRGRAIAMGELALAAVLFGVGGLFAKHATRGVHGAEVAFMRFFFGVVFVAVQSAVRGVPLRPKRWSVLGARGLFGGVAVLCFFVSLGHLPVGTATILNCTSPAFAVLFAAVFLGERVSGARGIALLVTGVGIVLVFIGQGASVGGSIGWQGLALCSGVVAGAAVATIRAARRSEGSWEIFGVFCLAGLVCTGPLALVNWSAPDGDAWAAIAGLGATFVIGQVLLTHALGVTDAATGVTIGQLTVVTSVVLGALVDGDSIGVWSGVGGVGVLFGVVSVARARG